MDAIESGIVKVPRTPVDDDATGQELVTYLRLWDHVGAPAPEAQPRRTSTVDRWLPPPELEGALRSLHRSYDKGVRALGDGRWRRSARRRRCSSSSARTPSSPSSSTTGSPASEVEVPDGDRRPQARPARAALNVVDGKPLARPRTILDRLGAARVRRGAEGRLQEGAAARDRGVQAGVPAAQPGADVEKIDRRASCCAR